MIQVSDQARTIINGYTRTFKAQFLFEGTALPCDIISIQINKGACDEFTVGSVYVPYIEVVANNLNADILNQQLDLLIGIVIDRDTDTTEWVQIGSYFVTTVRKTTDKTSFTANGILALKGQKMYNSTLSYPASVSTVLADIGAKMGLTIVSKGIQLTGTITSSQDGKLCIDVLRDVAGALGGFVTEDSQGRVVIAKHGSGENLVIDAFRTQNQPEFLDEFIVTGFEVIVTEDGYDDDGKEIPGLKYVYGTPNIIINNPITTQALFDVAKNNILGFSFEPTEFVMNMGDPTLEPWDTLSVVDVNGNTHIVPCINLRHKFDGGISTDVIANVQNTVTGAIAGAISSQLADMEAKLFTAQQAIIKRATITALDAESARIDALNTIKAYVETLITGNVTADSIVAQAGDIESLKTNKADVNLLNVNTAQITNGVIDNLSAGAIKSGTIDSGRINANTVVSNGLEANKASIGQIAANDANVKNLITESIDADQIVADGLDANKAAIGSIATESIDADTIVANGIEANKGDIADLVTQNLKTGSINGIAITDNSIVAKALSSEAVTTLSGIKLYYSADEPEMHAGGKNLYSMDAFYPYMKLHEPTDEGLLFNPANGTPNWYFGGLPCNHTDFYLKAKVKNDTGTNFRFRLVFADGYALNTNGTTKETGFVEIAYNNGSKAHGAVVEIRCDWSTYGSYVIKDLIISESPITEYEPYKPTDKDGHVMRDGDTWYQTVVDSDNTVDALYIWSGSEWSESEYDGSIIRANSITAQEIATNTITANNIAGNSLTIGNMDSSVMASRGERGQMEWSDNALHIISQNEGKTEKYETEIGGDGIKFKYQDQTVASIDQDQLVIDKTLVFTEMKIGNWSWAVNPLNGNLIVKWGGK